jgi:hypothetical protein
MASDRLSQIEARFEAKSESRDAEIKELRDAVVRVTEAERSNVELIATLGARIGTIEAKPEPEQPSLIAIWAPILATAIAMGSLFNYILGAKVDPEHERVNTMQQKQQQIDATLHDRGEILAGLKEKVESLENRMDRIQILQTDNTNILHESKANVELINKRLSEIDAMGVRHK